MRPSVTGPDSPRAAFGLRRAVVRLPQPSVLRAPRWAIRRCYFQRPCRLHRTCPGELGGRCCSSVLGCARKRSRRSKSVMRFRKRSSGPDRFLTHFVRERALRWRSRFLRPLFRARSPILPMRAFTLRQISMPQPVLASDRFHRRPYWFCSPWQTLIGLRTQSSRSLARPSKNRGRDKKPRSRTRPLYRGTQSRTRRLLTSTVGRAEKGGMEEVASQCGAALAHVLLDLHHVPLLGACRLWPQLFRARRMARFERVPLLLVLHRGPARPKACSRRGQI